MTRKLVLCLLLLAVAPGCRVLASAGVIAGAVAVEWAVSRYEEEPRCDHDCPCRCR